VKYIVREDPVGISARNYMTHVDLAPFGFPGLMEQVWLKEVRTQAYEMRCIPFRVYGVALGDEVRLTPDGSRVQAVLSRSGHRVLRVLLMPSLGVAGMDEMREAMISACSRLGLLHEWSGDRHVAVDVPPGGDAGELFGLVGAAVGREDAHWEWGDVMPFRS
jgi:hypothetical protein